MRTRRICYWKKREVMPGKQKQTSQNVTALSQKGFVGLNLGNAVY